MKLHYSPASPYVRKVRVSAIETGLMEGIELVAERLTPVDANAAVCADNPIGKIPTLVLDDGSTLFDSRVICEYLDSLHAGARLFPEAGQARWTALRRQALADGMLDAAVITRYESVLRPESHRWPEWIQGQKEKFRRATHALEAEPPGDEVDIGTIAIACALGYLDFRYSDEEWRGPHPKLSNWYARFSLRPSMQQTRPGELR